MELVYNTVATSLTTWDFLSSVASALSPSLSRRRWSRVARPSGYRAAYRIQTVDDKNKLLIVKVNVGNPTIFLMKTRNILHGSLS